MWWLLLLTGCDAALIEFPSTDLSFDVPVVDPASVSAACLDESGSFIAQFDASGRSPEMLATITTPTSMERHPLTIRSSGDTNFPVRYQLGPLLTGVEAEQVITGESTALRCDELTRTSVAIGMLDGFGVAVECVQWLGPDSEAPDESEPEFMDVGCLSFEL